MKPLRAIIFDLDGTLINSTIAFHKMKTLVISFLEQSGVQQGWLNTGLLNQDIEARARTYFHDHKIPDTEIARIFTTVTQIMNDVELEAIETVQPYPDANETLQHVSELGSILGILTRGCREYAEKALVKVQFQRFFTAIAARDEVSYAKPDPEHSQLLLTRLKVHPSETILVGDSQTDLLSAYNSNMRCVWINRQSSNLPPNIPRPDYELSSLTYLPEIVTIQQ
jgi:HAD superfamily hydrolase (TIGR01509 family)